jgi:hypothetical protein
VPNLHIPKRSYRPTLKLCPNCQSLLKRHHILWRKRLFFLAGPVDVVSWAYACPDATCSGADAMHSSVEAESLHLKYRRYSRELIIQIGYRRFWQHQTMYELHEWLTKDLQLPISERQVLNLIADFLALLRAAQPAKIRERLASLQRLIIGLDGMQPERGNRCLYVVRELQTGLTVMAETLEDGNHTTLSPRLLEPLKTLAQELGLSWHGVVSDAQASIRLALQQTLPQVPHQVCQFHCLRAAGEPIFEADRNLKKRLKSTVRRQLGRLERQIQHLPETDPYCPVLRDYIDAASSTLLEGGIAPFELGGVRIFEAMSDLAASLAQCQKKVTIVYCRVS